jgi:drug/metabolite transporter (DMT)-like permease
MSIGRFTSYSYETEFPMTRGSTGSTGSTGNAGGAGLLLAIVSAATFGTSGTFATSLLNAGWSAGAAVTARVGIAALVLTGPALAQLRQHLPTLKAGGPALLRRSAALVVLYGVFAIGVAQMCYFQAIQHLSVGVALLLEYLGIVLIVTWMWARHGQRPRRLSVIGSAGALLGLLCVLDLTSAHRLSPIGVLWGLGAAVGLAAYYLLSAHAEDPLPPIVMAWAALTVATGFLVVAGAAGVISMRAHFGDVDLGGHHTTWLVPVLGLSLVAAVIAYVTGIGAARRLGARLASFVGLTEVLFAILVAWALLGQLPHGSQLVGGVLILGGVALVRMDELRGEPRAEPVPVVAELDYRP